MHVNADRNMQPFLMSVRADRLCKLTKHPYRATITPEHQQNPLLWNLELWKPNGVEARRILGPMEASMVYA